MVVFLLNYCLVCMHFCIFRQLQALTVHSSYCDSHWMLQWLHLMNQFLHTHMICIWSPRCRKARLSLWLVLNFLYHTQSLTNINTWDFVLLCFFFSRWNNISPPSPSAALYFCSSELLSRCRCCLQISICVLFSRSWSKLINRSCLTDVCFTRLEWKLFATSK